MDANIAEIPLTIDRVALEPERPESRMTTTENEPSTPRQERLSRLLRRIGAVVLICSAIAFLLQQWTDLDSLLRYYSFLGFTLVLSGAGFFCGLYLREDKGARTFLSIAALFLPAHFAQLGALIFSRFISNHQALFSDSSEIVRSIAIYKAPSTLAAVGTLLVALVFLVPICYAGLSAMARVEARRLTAMYLLTNALLLVPTRMPGLIAVLALGAFGVLLACDLVFFNRHSAMKTWEGGAVRLMMFAPLCVLVGRSVILYPASELVLASVFGIIAALLFLFGHQPLKSLFAKSFVQALAVFPAALSWVSLMEGLFFDRTSVFGSAVAASIKELLFIPFNLLPVAVIIAGMSFGSVTGGSSYRRVAAAIAIFAAVAQLLSFGGVLSSFFCIVVSILVISSAFAMEEAGLFYVGVAGLAAGLLYQLRYAADLFTLSPWLSLAILGTLTVLAGSCLERRQGALQQTFLGLRQRLDSWQ